MEPDAFCSDGDFLITEDHFDEMDFLGESSQYYRLE